MGKQAKPMDRGGAVKAGKKKSYQAPPPVNLEKKVAREAGEQQFQSPSQLTVLASKFVVDKKTGRIVLKTYDEPVPFLYDPTRKRFVYSPPTKEK